jgi:hypothetical protein
MEVAPRQQKDRLEAILAAESGMRVEWYSWVGTAASALKH